MSETQRGNGGKFAKKVAEVKEDIRDVIEDVMGSVKENVKDVIENTVESVKENVKDVIEDTVKAIKSKLKHSEEYQIEGTGKSRHLAKGAKYFVGGELAEVLINAGKAKLAK